VEAEFEGRAKGHEFKEFLKGIDENLSHEQKIQVWSRKCDLEQAKLLYSKVQGVTMYPPSSDLKMFQFTGRDGDGTTTTYGASNSLVQDGIIQALGAVQGVSGGAGLGKGL